jgi:hypothetical protein
VMRGLECVKIVDPCAPQVLGEGEVISYAGSRILIDFDRAGYKRLDLAFVSHDNLLEEVNRARWRQMECEFTRGKSPEPWRRWFGLGHPSLLPGGPARYPWRLTLCCSAEPSNHGYVALGLVRPTGAAFLQ